MNRKMDRYIETGRVEKERKRYRKKAEDMKLSQGLTCANGASTVQTRKSSRLRAALSPTSSAQILSTTSFLDLSLVSEQFDGIVSVKTLRTWGEREITPS